MNNTFEESASKFNKAIQGLTTQKLADLIVETKLLFLIKGHLKNKGFTLNSTLATPFEMQNLIQDCFKQAGNQKSYNIFKKSSYSTWSGMLKLVSRLSS